MTAEEKAAAKAAKAEEKAAAKAAKAEEKAAAKAGSTAPTTAPTQTGDSKHGINGHEIKEYVASEPTGFPKSQTVYQADEAVSGDFIVEWVQNSEHVTFHPESNGKFHPLNEQRVTPTVHTRVFSPKHREDAEADAKEFADTLKGAKIYRK